ncbi:amidohydrolase family protein [Kaistia sp. 32K]|uniref:amidohydrolase family protein n=1 Tax=Kaistia sp. 32K TaxID=2795690 RepID=UPI001914F09B|nr:amidohydrolase family protein [Kaistia sp. 32K]
MSTTTAIFGSYVLAERQGEPEMLRDQWLLIEGNRIVALQDRRPQADRVLDEPGRLVLPGLLNLHNHCCAEAFSRSRTEDLPMASGDDLLRVLGPISGTGSELLKSLSRPQRLDIARLGVLQLLKGGTTTVMEPFRNWFPEMFDAAAEMGIRFYGAPYLFSKDPAGNEIGASCLEAWDELFETWHQAADGRIRVVMSPHGSDTCDRDLLLAATRRAREVETQITLHLAQSEGEVATVSNREGGKTPIEFLDSLGMLGPDLLAAHCILASDDDLRTMAATGSTIVNCPRTYARAGVTAAFSRFREHGVRTLVGTDGYNMDLISELGAAALISKCRDGRADVATSRDLIAAVTREAANAVSRPDLGRIAIGATADLTVLSLESPFLRPLQDPVKAVVALGCRADVDIVMVDGEIVVQHGDYTRSNETEIVERGTAALDMIMNSAPFQSILPAH